MCGIVGIVSNRNVSEKLLDAIKRLEYRGYDSVGMVCLDKNFMSMKKDIGKIDDVDKTHKFSELQGTIGLAHCRWATTGAVTKENAHPHTDCTKKISLVHNGIIENYEEVKQELLQKGHLFSSSTDTEIIAHLIEENYKGDIRDATIQALKKIKGSYALGIIHTDNPDKIIAAKNESPLVIGLGEGENYIASDVPAILKYTNKIVYLEDHEIAELSGNKVEVFDFKNNLIAKKVFNINWSPEQAEKQGFDHFMLKEIFEQPRAIEDTLSPRLDGHFVNLINEINIDLDFIKNIVIVACGTSWHAGLYGRFILEGIAKIPTQVEYASEFRYKEQLLDEDTLVIAISQSGETADTLAAIKEAKRKNLKVLSIVNVKGSSIDRISDSSFYTYAGPEIGVASTKAFTTQLILLYLLTLHIGKLKNTINEEVIKDAVKGLRKIPLQMQSVLEESKNINELAKSFYKKNNALYLGRGVNFPIALEGALKLKEVSYIHAEGYPAAEMKHGPIALIDKDMPVIFITTKDAKTYSKILGNIEEVKARGGEIIAVATEGDDLIKGKANHILYVPNNLYTLEPILSVVYLQLFAYYIAKLRKCDIDKPRNLAKAVVVE